MTSNRVRVPAFVRGLREQGDRTAVVTAREHLSYRELADRVERTADAIGPGRRLVLVEAANDLATLVAHLGALYGGHVVLPVARGDRTGTAELTARFDPDVVAGADGVRARRAGGAHRLHPELALLLATSGSTGVPRLVRLSAAALDANATAIATCLGIRAGDRAALTLPLHYCYGLSVIHSNLARGAAVLLSDASVLDPGFWRFVREHRATSLHGVPHTFDLLDRGGFATATLPDLRYVTQAGGRLDPDRVRHWARVGRERGWAFHVMYGQTEATARMACLPPDLAEEHPHAVGFAVPGGSFTVEDGGGTDGVGELIYHGANVMLGYADGPDDLARGRTVTALRTGDLGRVGPDGLVEVVGRRSRFVKPFGVRTDLDGLERLLADHGVEAACTGTDTAVVLAAVGGPLVGERALAVVTERAGLPAPAVTVVPVPALPRRPNGKLDHPAVARLAPPERARRRPATIRAVYARTFPGQELDPDASFVDLGGDSLTYVRVAADVERVLGHLPAGWEHLPLARLDDCAPADPAPRRGATVETGVLLRAAAVVLVVAAHTHALDLVGGAHLLLALSGWTFARFLVTGTPAGLPRRILLSTARLAVPSMLWIALRAALHGVRWIDVLLLGALAPPLVAGYWFVDTLVQILLVLALVFAVPAVRDRERRHPFGFAAALLVLALPGTLFPTAYGWWFRTDVFSPQVVLWLFVLGWVAQRTRTAPQRVATLLAVAVLVPAFFRGDLDRTLVVGTGLLLLLARSTMVVPRPVAAAATRVAAASLGIYLTHFGVLRLADLGVPPVLVAATGIATGLAVTAAATATARSRRQRPAPPPRDLQDRAVTIGRRGSRKGSP